MNHNDYIVNIMTSHAKKNRLPWCGIKVEHYIWKTWCRLINIIRRLQTEDDCGCRQGFRTWYLLSCVMSHQDLFWFVQLCTMSECFKISRMCPTFVLIKIMTAGHRCDAFLKRFTLKYFKQTLYNNKTIIQSLPDWVIRELSDLPPPMVKFRQ